MKISEIFTYFTDTIFLHAAVGKEPQGFVHVEQRRVLDAQTP